MAEALTVAETSAEPPPPPQRSAAGEGRGGGSVPAFSANIETTTDTALAPHQLPPDDAKTAAIEVAKARAAARKAARIAQNSEAETPTAVASPAEQPLSPWERGWGEGEKNEDKEPAPHQLPPDDGKTAAIEVAKARAAARKAARLAQQPLNEEASAQNPPTPPHPSPAGGGSASMAETPTGQPITLPQTEEQAETSMTPPDNDDKTTRDAKLAAARAKSEERRIAHAKLKQHMRDTAIPIRPQSDEQK